jgi:hypothetical protein
MRVGVWSLTTKYIGVKLLVNQNKERTFKTSTTQVSCACNKRCNLFHLMESKTNHTPLETVDSIHLDGDAEFEDHNDYEVLNKDSELIPDEEEEIDYYLISSNESDESVPSANLNSTYGAPVSPAEAAALCPPGNGGLTYHSQLVGDHWTHPKDCDSDGRIKPRRATLPCRQKDFFSSLVKTDDGRWLFSGVLNGWPALTCLEVRSITCLANSRSWFGRKKVVRFWSAEADKDRGRSPTFPDGLKSVRVTLRAAPWTAKGWTANSPGCVWWYESLRCLGESPEDGVLSTHGGPRLTYGEDMIRSLQLDLAKYDHVEPIATRIHHFAHRYARPGKNGYETSKQKLTYHGAILLEWDHGRHCTVVELATLNGVGGRSGKANWYPDKSQNLPMLYRSMPTSMIMPWKGKYAEIRVHDVECKHLEEFKLYVDSFTGTEQRFLDPHFIASGTVRIFSRKQTDIQRYLLNYMGRDRRYSEEYRNCQTFAADFYGFMAGKSGIEPYSKVNRVAFKNRSHNFLYSPELYGAPHE